MSESSAASRSTAPRSEYNHLSLDCVIATLVLRKLVITHSVWNCFDASSCRQLLQLSGSFRDDLLQDLHRLAILSGFQPWSKDLSLQDWTPPEVKRS